MDDTEPRFEVVRPLGAGATARVELVRLAAPFAGLPAGTELACKSLADRGGDERAAREAFRAESAAASEVQAPSLVRLFFHGERAGRPYLLLQYVPGRTLRELLEQDGALPEPRLRKLGAELADALAALHAHGLVHGDVKPENARLDQEGRAVLLDLGFARRLRGEPSPGPARSLADAGSLAYLSPERVRGETAGPAADVFALGIVLYELATGLHPFTPASRRAALGRHSTSGAIVRRSLELSGADELLAALDAARFPPASRLVPALSPFFERLLEDLLARAREDRPPAEEVAARLRSGEGGDWWQTRGAWREERTHEDDHPSAWPLVGREAELQRLDELYSEVAAAPPRAAVVWLVGPEGSGKWRLLTSFARRVRAGSSPPLVLAARWNEADEGRPAGTALMLLNRWLALQSGRAPHAREIERLTERVGPAAARPLVEALDPKRGGSPDRSVPAELARWLARLAEERPVLVFLDDLHQAGAVTLGALSTLLELLRTARVLFVLSLREDAPAAEPAALARLAERLQRAGPDGARFQRLILAPLEPSAVGTLVARLFHDSQPLARLGEVLWRRSRGNPGFLTEILRELEKRGGVRPWSDEDPRWILTVAPDELPMPRSLDRLLRERLTALETGERIWLERLSVVGGRLTPEFLVAAFPPTKRVEVDDVLARLTRKGWLVPAEDRYRFERPALREALYRALAPARRRRLHAAAARGLGAEPEDLEQAYQRAFHLHAAGEYSELLATLRVLLPELRRRASAQRLATLARYGLEALEQGEAGEKQDTLRLELLEDAADAADRLGEREDQRELLDNLAGIALDPERQPAEAARLYLLHARYAAGTGQYGLARGWLKSAVSFAARSRDPWLESQALRRLAQVQAQVGEFAEARKLAKQAERRARGENQEALALLALAHVDVLEGETERALTGVEEALALLRRTREPRAGVLSYAELLRARLWRSAGLPRRSLGAIQRAVLLARRAGERRLEAEALARRGGILLDLGRPKAAKVELRDALLLAQEIEDRRGQVLATLWLGQLEAEQGEASAHVTLSRAVELARGIAFSRAEAVALALLARLARQAGEIAAADGDSARAHELVQRHGAELSDRIVVTGTRAFLLFAQERRAEAERCLADLARRVRLTERRTKAPELRRALRAYSDTLLAATLSPEGPVFPRSG